MVTTEKSIEIFNRTPIRKGTTFSKDDSHRPVSFITESEVYRLADAARTMRNGERDYLLILVLFQTCLRISEALQLSPGHMREIDGVHVMGVIGKGSKNYPNGKPRLVVVPEKLFYHVGCFARKLPDDERIFPITRVRAWQIVRQAASIASLDYKRIYPHLMRHGGAVTRLMKTGNMKSLQLLLGHTDQKMTLRYQATMQTIQALDVESRVTFER